ncbi:MAG TPA: phosphotransferase [Propionibacteriaceae bacterium]|nr:phosphotransferase [Propionibacteriaceae bacterium]
MPDEPLITADLVHRLVREQHPDLAGLPIREVPGGWDNLQWRLGDDLVVRMPRTERAPALQRKECRWLPVLAPRLPLPVPLPVRLGRPSAYFPGPWTIMTWVPGEPLDRATIDRPEDAADRLAAFLAALHQPAPPGAPPSSDGRLHPRACTEGFDHFFQAVAPSELAGEIRAIWDDAVAAPDWEGPALWVHGDLHPANVVVSGGTLGGVIDFGDLFAGDPAWDLAAAWVILPAGLTARFFAAYGPTDAGTLRRARGLAALKSLFLMLMGRNGDLGLPGGKTAWGPLGRAALERVLNDPGPAGSS